ncbi:MAG TPA: hypothetical protein VGL08_16335 [Paraburkholderia sp.]|jgi:hypothetical protein
MTTQTIQTTFLRILCLVRPARQRQEQTLQSAPLNRPFVQAQRSITNAHSHKGNHHFLNKQKKQIYIVLVRNWKVGVVLLADLRRFLGIETCAGGQIGDCCEITVLTARQAPVEHTAEQDRMA